MGNSTLNVSVGFGSSPAVLTFQVCPSFRGCSRLPFTCLFVFVLSTLSLAAHLIFYFLA